MSYNINCYSKLLWIEINKWICLSFKEDNEMHFWIVLLPLTELEYKYCIKYLLNIKPTWQVWWWQNIVENIVSPNQHLRFFNQLMDRVYKCLIAHLVIYWFSISSQWSPGGICFWNGYFVMAHTFLRKCFQNESQEKQSDRKA